MKTFSEYEAENRLRMVEDRSEHNARCKALLESSTGVPVYKPASTSDMTDYESYRKYIREALTTGKVAFYDLVCDHCSTELINNEPGSVYASNPPCQRISCPGCGWTGFTRIDRK